MVRTDDWVLSLGEQLRQKLEVVPAVRLGESTVISRAVHVLEVERPEQIKVITSADAGCVFYGRKVPGTILHVDIFHEIGKVAHRAVAARIKETLIGFKRDAAWTLLDHMDLQTATGGGRVSGSLNYGQKESVRRAHANHVHIAVELEGSALGLLVPLVIAVEEEILNQRVEIRKVDRVLVTTQAGTSGKGADLSPYASQTDSLLKEQDSGQSGTGTAADGAAQREQMEQAIRTAQKTLPPEELHRLFSNLPLRAEEAVKKFERWGDLEHTLGYLQAKQLVKREGGRLVLTPAGRDLRDLLTNRLPELEARFRQLLRRVPLDGTGQTRPIATSLPGSIQTGRVAPCLMPKVSGSEIDLASTVLNAARNWYIGASVPGTIGAQDIAYLPAREDKQAEIILVLDTSASMAGERLRAARFLAEHLVLATRAKVAVIAFQEQDVIVPQGFSRGFRTIHEQLLALRAYGLTPLARALQDTANFIAATRVKRPLVVLITDGIPTVPLKSGDPAEDSLLAAEQLGRMRLELICIGLDPNRRFLSDLCSRGRGRLHIIQELESATLAQLIHGELTGRLRGRK
jgi:magnesium chelatase subunit D